MLGQSNCKLEAMLCSDLCCWHRFFVLVGVETSVLLLGAQTANLCFLMVSHEVSAVSIFVKANT